GARLSGALGWFRYALAFVNGNPLGVSAGFPLQDPNNHKDFVARISGELEPAPQSRLGVGVSATTGRGFSKGTDPTNNSVVWRDGNENNNIALPGELSGSPAQAGRPSENFERWAVGGDLQLETKLTPIGKTKLYGEIQVGSNMDRALYIADPIALSQDTRE